MKIALSALALALVAGSAFAADLPARKAEPLLPPPPPPMWTGFYAGLNIGGTWGNNNGLNVSTWPTKDLSGYWTTAAPLTGGHASQGAAGFIGGGQAGYNWRSDLQGHGVVVGFEADIQGVAGSSGFGQAPFSAAVLTFSNHDSFGTYSTTSSANALSYLGTARGRLGYLVSPSLLIYGTGGLAYGGASLSLNQFQQFGIALGSSYANTAKTLAGWTAGGGVEWMFLPNWSVKAEYLFYNLGALSTSNTFVAFSPSGGQWTYDAYASRTFSGNIVRAGLNHHFNWGGSAPTIANY